MTAGRTERRPVKIRRRGRHVTPSQVDRVAAQAGKAAPAVAIAGALVAAPQAAHAATSARPAVTTVASAAQHSVAKAVAQSTYYKVRSGDTLSKIAGDYYHKTSDWQWLYHENAKRLSSPDDIYPGESVYVPADPPADYTPPKAYQPRHAKSSARAGDTVVTQSARKSGASSHGSRAALSGTLGCSGLEQLWENAGGSAAEAVTAASVAMAESGGNQYALSPTNDYGYWQINASNGALATFNPYGNARAAIQLSGNGTHWGAWTTYTSGAYQGKC